LVPGSQKFRLALASAAVTPTALWGSVVTGRMPTRQACAHYARLFREAVKGRASAGGRESRELQRAFHWGPASDFHFATLSRALRSLGRWCRQRRELGGVIPDYNPDSTPLRCISKLTAQYGWQSNNNWMWIGDQGRFKATTSVAHEEGLHNLREAWRKKCFEKWLQSERRDAAVAREQDVKFAERVSTQLHKACLRARTADHAAILLGGFSTEATCESPVPFCPDCEELVVPSLEHVLWRCRAYANLRTEPPPVCPLAQRLCWGNLPEEDPKDFSKRLDMMAAIRSQERHNRRARWRLEGRGVRPPPRNEEGTVGFLDQG
jgi:hypothetical protein